MELTNALQLQKFRESSSLLNSIAWIISKLDRTNYPEPKFDTSLTYPNRIIFDNSTTRGLDILDELKGAYEFSNIEEIRNFIMQNNYLINILNEAPENIYRIFDRRIKLILELRSDPEEEWDELFIVIKSPYTAEKTVALGKKLFYEWFIHIMNKVNDKLNFIEELL